MKKAQVGDYKLPNKYWVTVHNDYYINNDGCLDWASDTRKFKPFGKTIGVYSTYKKAREVFDGIELGDKIRGKSIEDRLTGQLCEEVLEEKKTFEPFFNEDLKFSQETMKKRGVLFKK